jgi:hypothetical protein
VGWYHWPGGEWRRSEEVHLLPARVLKTALRSLQETLQTNTHVQAAVGILFTGKRAAFYVRLLAATRAVNMRDIKRCTRKRTGCRNTGAA